MDHDDILISRTTPRRQGPRVLIADDDGPMAHAIERVLRAAGYETAVACDGHAAQALFRAFQPSLMTLDLRMPGRGGMQVLDFIGYLQETKQAPACKVLIVSADRGADAELAEVCGVHGTLPKPFDNAVLLSEVARLLALAAKA